MGYAKVGMDWYHMGVGVLVDGRKETQMNGIKNPFLKNRIKHSSSYFPGEKELIERMRKRIEAHAKKREKAGKKTSAEHRWKVDRSAYFPGEKEMIERVRKKVEAHAKKRAAAKKAG